MNVLGDEVQHYRTRLRIVGDGKADVVHVVISALFSWVKPKFHGGVMGAYFDAMSEKFASGFSAGGFSYPEGWSGSGTTTASKAVCVDSVEYDGTLCWAMELDEEDGSQWERRWHTRVGVSGGHDEAEVNIQISYYTDRRAFREPRKPGPNVPRVLAELVGLEGCRTFIGGMQVCKKATYLTADSFESEFLPTLTDQNRALPVVLVTTDFQGKEPIDIGYLADNLAGMAKVYVANFGNQGLRASMFNAFPKKIEGSRGWGMGNGSLAIYQPGVNLSEPSDRARLAIYSEHQMKKSAGNPAMFLQELRRGLGRSIGRRANDVLSIADIAWRKSRQRSKESEKRLKELSERRHSAPVNSASEDIEALRTELNDAQEEAQEWEELSTQIQHDLNDANARIDELAAENSRLVAKNDSLEFNLSKSGFGAQEGASSEVIAACKKLPSNLSGSLRLASVLFANRLAISERAYEGAEAWDRQSQDDGWELIYAIATELWSLRFEDSGNQRTDIAFANRTGLEYSPNESKLTVGSASMMRMRKATVDGAEYDCIPHVKGRNGKEALRIHLAFDDENRRIVIGHCGEHLDTAGTTRKGY